MRTLRRSDHRRAEPTAPPGSWARAWPPASLSLFLAILAFCAAGCVWKVPPDEELLPEPRAERPLGGVSAHNLALLNALAGAVEDGDDTLAQGLLVRLRTRSLSTHEEGLADAFERVLRGRALSGQLSLTLVSEPAAQPGRYRLFLTAENEGVEDVVLNLPPADLTRLCVGVVREGNERSEYDNRVVDLFAGLVLAAGAREELELFEYDLGAGPFLAVRERWQLRTRSGEIRAGDEAYPAANLQVAPCERVCLGSEAPADPAGPEELARLCEGEEPLAGPELLEVAVRVRPEDRDSALRTVAPYVERWAATEPDRVRIAAPALRWLSTNTTLGGEAQAWNRYLRARLRPRVERPVLELPGHAGATPDKETRHP